MAATFITDLIAGTIIFAICAPIVGKLLVIVYAFLYMLFTGIKNTITILYRIGRKRLSGEYTAKEAFKAFFESGIESNHDLD